jgi:hypothetical protein
MVRPELPTAAVGSSQAPTATVDNSAPSATRPQSTYKSGKLFRQTGPLLMSSAALDQTNGLGLSLLVLM